MIFRRSGKIIKQFDEKLLSHLQELRTQLAKQKLIIENSVDPSEDILCHLKITEAKYFFLIKEARKRGVRIY